MHLYQRDVFWSDLMILEYSSWKSKNADAMESGLVKPDPLYIKGCRQIQFEMQNKFENVHVFKKSPGCMLVFPPPFKKE